MTEAVRLTVDHAFNVLRLARLIAWADEQNTASRRVMEKMGMQIGGTEKRFVKGEYRPYVRYELPREAWEATR